MRVLMVHDYYTNWGGEDASYEQEVSLLRQYGHDVETYTRHNAEIEQYSLIQKGRLFYETTWSSRNYQDLQAKIDHFRPSVVHVQNFFPLISPSIFYACAATHTPVILSLRNYRLLCPKATFFRDGQRCEECQVQNSFWPSIIHRCYRDSAIQTAAVVTMLNQHHRKKTWIDKVDGYITLTEFAKQKLAEGGLPGERIYVRPDFLVDDPGLGVGSREYAIFVGRLTAEKGILTLLDAWRQLPDMPLKIVGDGPLKADVARKIAALGLNHVELCGFIDPDQVASLIKGANLLVMPSEWYETFGRTIIEAYAAGTPVLASRLGTMAELVTDNCEGKLFTAGDAEDLARQALAIYAQPEQLTRWGENARLKFERYFSALPAYQSISTIYQEVIQKADTRPDAIKK